MPATCFSLETNLYVNKKHHTDNEDIEYQYLHGGKCRERWTRLGSHEAALRTPSRGLCLVAIETDQLAARHGCTLAGGRDSVVINRHPPPRWHIAFAAVAFLSSDNGSCVIYTKSLLLESKDRRSSIVKIVVEPPGLTAISRSLRLGFFFFFWVRFSLIVNRRSDPFFHLCLY